LNQNKEENQSNFGQSFLVVIKVTSH